MLTWIQETQVQSLALRLTGLCTSMNTLKGLIHLVCTDLFLLEVVTSSLLCMDLSVSQPWCIKKLS